MSRARELYFVDRKRESIFSSEEKISKTMSYSGPFRGATREEVDVVQWYVKEKCLHPDKLPSKGLEVLATSSHKRV